MKKFYLTRFLFIIALSLILSSEVYATDFDLLKPGIVIIAYDNSFPPYGWVEEGKPVGFELDMLKAVIEKMGLKVEFQPDVWAKVQASVKLRKADAIATIGITEERRKSYDYSESYTNFASVLFVKVENNSVQGLKDLEGQVVAVQKDSFQVPYLRQNYPSIQLYQTDSPLSALEAVLSDKAVGALADELVGLYFTNQNFPGKLKTVGEKFSETPVALAVLKGTKAEFLEKFNQALSEIKADGTYDRIYAHWFK